MCKGSMSVCDTGIDLSAFLEKFKLIWIVAWPGIQGNQSFDLKFVKSRLNTFSNGGRERLPAEGLGFYNIISIHEHAV